MTGVSLWRQLWKKMITLTTTQPVPPGSIIYHLQDFWMAVSHGNLHDIIFTNKAFPQTTWTSFRTGDYPGRVGGLGGSRTWRQRENLSMVFQQFGNLHQLSSCCSVLIWLTKVWSIFQNNTRRYHRLYESFILVLKFTNEQTSINIVLKLLLYALERVVIEWLRQQTLDSW